MEGRQVWGCPREGLVPRRTDDRCSGLGPDTNARWSRAISQNSGIPNVVMLATSRRYARLRDRERGSAVAYLNWMTAMPSGDSRSRTTSSRRSAYSCPGRSSKTWKHTNSWQGCEVHGVGAASGAPLNRPSARQFVTGHVSKALGDPGWWRRPRPSDRPDRVASASCSSSSETRDRSSRNLRPWCGG